MKRFLFYGLIMGACCVVGCQQSVPEEKVVVRPVRYGLVKHAGKAQSHTFSGTAQSGMQANLSFRVAGTIVGLKAKVGDQVRKGQTIALLDQVDYYIQYDQAVAQLKSAETQLILARSTYQRVEQLYENNSVPLSEYESAKGQYDAAVSQVTASQKQVEASKNQVSYARLTAPYSGVITNLMVEENELVGSGTPVAMLSSAGDPEVLVGIPELFINRVKSGQKVEVRFSIIQGKTYKGTVSEVSFGTGNTSTYPVTVKINDPDSRIRPGMAANVSFNFNPSTTSEPEEKIIAPVKAVGEGVDGHFVFVLEDAANDTYTVRKKNIRLGSLLPEGFEIQSGLADGDRVATAGLKSLLDGMTVRLLEE